MIALLRLPIFSSGGMQLLRTAHISVVILGSRSREKGSKNYTSMRRRLSIWRCDAFTVPDPMQGVAVSVLLVFSAPTYCCTSNKNPPPHTYSPTPSSLPSPGHLFISSEKAPMAGRPEGAHSYYLAILTD
jgi:hypothetical protein